MLAAYLVGEQSIVADAVKAIGFFGTIVFPLEGNALLIKGDQAAVSDRDPMSVAGQVGEHGLGTGERTFGIDHPVYLA